MQIVFGLFLIVIGVISIFDKETAWKMQEFSNQLRGTKSERSSTWETIVTLGGVILLIAGLVIFVTGISPQ